MKKGKIIIAGAAICGLGLFDSFLLDPFLLIIAGILVAYAVSRSAKNFYLRRRLLIIINILVMALFWIVGVGLYFNLPIASWISQAVGAQSGRDWMINSGIFHFDFKNPSAASSFVSGFLFAIYPLWLILGEKLGTILFGAQKGNKGLIGLLGLK